jgi:hypothetical protein
VLAAWNAHRLKDDQVIGLYADTPPFIATRMEFRKFPQLKKRANMPPPSVKPLPDAAQTPPASEASTPQFFIRMLRRASRRTVAKRKEVSNWQRGI